MTALRQRMVHDLLLRGYSDRTVEAYVPAVAQLAQSHHASPGRLRSRSPHLHAPRAVARAGTRGIPAVLHNRSRTLEYHRHAHAHAHAHGLVTAAGLTLDGAA